MRKLLFMAFAAIALWGCGDASNDIEITDNTRNETEILWSSSGERLWESSHFITEYVVPTNIKAICNVPGNIYIKATGDVYKTYRGKDYKDYNKALYFAKKYGDISYKGKVSEGQHTALAYPIEKITIWCDEDFDAEHPAGEPLDDIVNLKYTTFHKFIESGYKSTFDNPMWLDPEEEVFLLPFSSINADITKLIGSNLANYGIGNIKFISNPEELGEYTFTLEVTIKGEVFKHTFNFTFLSNE